MLKIYNNSERRLNLILCGLKGSGKSTVGKLLAEALQLRFIDTDALIERAYGLSCRTLHQQRGETFFRSAEAGQIALLKETTHSVIALGGGSLQNAQSRWLLQQLGTLIYLKCAQDALDQRVGPFPVDTQQRISLYTQIAHLTVDTTSLSPEEAVSSILRVLHNPSLDLSATTPLYP